MAPKTLNITFAGDSSALSRTFKSINSDAGKLGSGLLKLGGIAAKGLAVGVTAASVAFGGLAVKGLKMNAELETSTKAFETLMGDATKAEEHVKSLFDFAAKTPFETGPIIEASRHLQTFGGEALNTKDSLQLIGDAAAATGQEINEVGFWTGRAYSMIQSGKPFGEAAMRLQEMGIMSPKARDEMERLQKSGASASEVWAVFTKELGKFNGAMVEQSTTWSGLMSTLSDVVAMGAGQLFKPLFDAVKNLASAFIDFTATDTWSGWLDSATSKVENFSSGINTAAEQLRTFTESGAGLEGMFAGGANVGTSFATDFITGLKAGLAGGTTDTGWTLSLSDKGTETGASFASNLGIGLASALPTAFQNLDYASVIHSISGGLLAVLPLLPWAEIVQVMASTFLTTMTNLDWGALILTGINIFDEIVVGFVTGVIQAFQRDSMTMILGIIGILFAPAKWIDSLAGALNKIPFVGTVFSWITKHISEVGERMKRVIGERFGSAFSSGIDFSMDFLRQLPSKAIGALGNMGSVLWNAGSSLMQGLLSGILAGWNRVAANLRNKAAEIKALKGPIDQDRKLLQPEGAAIMEGLLKGIASKQGSLAQLMGGVTDQLTVTGGLSPGTLSGAAVAGAGSGSLTVQLVVDGRVLAEVVDEQFRAKLRANPRLLSTA